MSTPNKTNLAYIAIFIVYLAHTTPLPFFFWRFLLFQPPEKRAHGSRPFTQKLFTKTEPLEVSHVDDFVCHDLCFPVALLWKHRKHYSFSGWKVIKRLEVPSWWKFSPMSWWIHDTRNTLTTEMNLASIERQLWHVLSSYLCMTRYLILIIVCPVKSNKIWWSGVKFM